MNDKSYKTKIGVLLCCMCVCILLLGAMLIDTASEQRHENLEDFDIDITVTWSHSPPADYNRLAQPGGYKC
jgi:hypothetical protein